MKKEVLITPQQMTGAIHKVTTSDRLKPLVDKAPILSLAFTLFGAELMKTIFDIQEEQK